jgi:hypothetical protein
MNRIKAALSRKIGPLPAWAWALIAGAALFFIRRAQGGAVAAGPDQSGAPPPSYYGPYGQDAYPIQGSGAPGGGDTGTGNPAGGPPQITVNPPAPTTPGPGGGHHGKRTPKPQNKHKPKPAKAPPHKKNPRTPAQKHPQGHEVQRQKQHIVKPKAKPRPTPKPAPKAPGPKGGHTGPPARRVPARYK